MQSLKANVRVALDTVHANQSVRQDKNKVWYDAKARAEDFVAGNLVLVLQPVDGKPLVVKYVGPYKVLRKTSPVDYVVEFTGRRKAERNLHVNILRRYVTRIEFVNTVVGQDVTGGEEGEGDYNLFVHPKESVPVDKLIDDKLHHLSLPNQAQVRGLLGDFAEVFSDVPGCTDLVKHCIKLKPNATVVRLRPYRLSPEVQDKLKVEIETLLAEGLIAKSSSEWSSPVIVVPKADKTIRAVVDFRRANDQFEGESFPLPLIEDLLDRVGQSRFLTKLDLSKGFYQIPLEDSSMKYTAFCTPFGLFEWRRLPFGLKTSPSQFQSLMQRVLEGLDFCAAFMDDIVIFSMTWVEHVNHMRAVFDRLKRAKLTVKLSKCFFGCREIEYLGHRIGNGRLSPKEAKVLALLEMPRPANKKTLQSFIGSVNYYHRYVQNFAEIAAPLTHLLKKDVTFVWSAEAEKGYQLLLRILSTPPVLVVADFAKPFVLFTDASGVAVSCVLAQLDESGIYRPVAYMSRKLNPAQVNYSTIEREALGIVLGVRTFRIYLSGSVTIFSDHQPLSFIGRMSVTNQRILRWSLELAPYDLVVKHIKGTANCFADFLSRPSGDVPSLVPNRGTDACTAKVCDVLTPSGGPSYAESAYASHKEKLCEKHNCGFKAGALRSIGPCFNDAISRKRQSAADTV